MASKTEYNAKSIQALDQHQHLMKRLSLILGKSEGPDEKFSSQKNVSIREILDNAIDEVRAGYGDYVKISFYEDTSFEIQDSGRGIPVDKGLDADGNPASGIYLAMGLLQAGGKFSTDAKRFSSGLNGLGGSAVIHCSKRADITVFRGNNKYELSFQDGTPGFFATDDDPDSKFTPLKDLTKVKKSKDTRSAAEKKNYKTGTIVKVWLRDEVFSSDNPYDPQDIIERVRGTAFLVPNLHAEVYNELNKIEDPATGELHPQTEFFNFPNGIEQLIELNQTDTALHDLIHIKTEGKYLEKNVAVLQDNGKVVNKDLERIVPIEVAFSYGDKYDTNVETFVNTIHTKLHGSHLTAFERALKKSFVPKFSSMRGILKKDDPEPIPEDFMEGLTAVVSVQVSEPQFTSQSKEALSGREVLKAIENALVEEFDKWIKSTKNKAALEMIAKKVTTAAKNRQKAKDQRELNRKKNAISASSLPAKLIDCEFSDSEDGELYICEGDSAVSSLKAARDGRIHALLGIRGKIINAHKSTPTKVIANNEVQDIIKTLGAGSGDNFDINAMRYGRVFLAVDADPDGDAIACLLYALFWHLFRPVIEEGRLYKIETPLFSIATKEGKKSKKLYARNEKGRDRIVKRLESKGIKHSVTRLKGLGEVMADTLYETSLSPDSRVITQVTVSDADEAEKALDMILGKDTEARKVWIEESEINEEAISA